MYCGLGFSAQSAVLVIIDDLSRATIALNDTFYDSYNRK